jgi:AraC-like DNA-binding protein
VTPALKLAALIPGTEAPGSKDRKVRPFVGSRTPSERLQLADAPVLEQFYFDSGFGVRGRVQSPGTDPLKHSKPAVETSSLPLAARLVHSHLETELIQPPIRSRHRLDDARLRRVLAYIEEQLAEDITVADLANVACLSIFHFTRAFAAAMGVPPHRYVSRRRLESAKVMLATGRASLGEIAYHCRFSSQSSFTRAFRRAIGMTPGEYRRTLR